MDTIYEMKILSTMKSPRLEVYVFKTSIQQDDVVTVNNILSLILPDNSWSFDLEDCDNILRIESEIDISKLTCLSLKLEGYYCEELE